MIYALCLAVMVNILSLTAPVSARQPRVRADVKDPGGVDIGSVFFTQTEKGVRLNISLIGMPPGNYAIHIHENGSCIPPDFTSAGAHFNPSGKEHGFMNPEGAHAGDLPNITVDEGGSCTAEFTTDLLTLEKAKNNSLLKEGKTAIVIHKNPDDYVSDPAGSAGDRLACGVIEEENEPGP